MKRIVKLLLFVLVLCMCCVALAEETGTECTEHDYSAWGYSDAVEGGNVHYPVCQYCGVKNFDDANYVHIVTCENPAECVVCGSTNVAEAQVNHTDWTFGSDDAQHWYECSACGQNDNYELHNIDCSTPGVCVTCERTGVTGNASHDWNMDTKSHDGTHHWNQCKNCDEKVNYGEHYSKCNAADKTVCAECGQSGVTINEGHTYDLYTFFYDKESHWAKCIYCPETVNQSNHSTNCSAADKTTCEVCGQSGVTISGGVTHFVDDWENSWKSDGIYHWHICDECGEQVDYGDHYVSCVDGLCRICGATCDPTEEVEHTVDNWNNMAHDSANHWRVCDECGEKFDIGTHWLDCQTGACRECGATDVEGEVGHDWGAGTWTFDETHHTLTCQWLVASFAQASQE